MANKEITVPHSRSQETWDPLGDFRTLLGVSDPFGDLFPGFPATRLPATPRAWIPKVNIKETEKEYVITAALPGIKKEDVKVELQDGVLTLSGEHKEEKEEKSKGYLRQEMSCGCFSRSFILPTGVHPENLKASHKDGMLTVTVPKLDQGKSRGVSVKID